jgi:hypothetical protein
VNFVNYLKSGNEFIPPSAAKLSQRKGDTVQLVQTRRFGLPAPLR